MKGMLGGRKNRCEHGALECPYGCCRSLVTGKKAKTRRILRRRDQRQWRKEENQ
jgi:hypothetical protein